MTKCNYCLLCRMRARAAEQGKQVTITPSHSGGVDVYIHPADRDYVPWQSDAVPGDLSAWFMALPDCCAC